MYPVLEVYFQAGACLEMHSEIIGDSGGGLSSDGHRSSSSQLFETLAQCSATGVPRDDVKRAAE